MRHDFDYIDADDIEAYRPLIGQLHNRIAARLAARPASYQPLFEMYPELGSDRRQGAHAWCQGFMTATVLRDAQWETLLLQSRAGIGLLYPIWEHANEDPVPTNRSARRSARRPKGKVKLNAEQIKAAVLGMRSYWSRA